MLSRRGAGPALTLGVVVLAVAAVAFYATTHGEARLTVAQGTGRNPSIPAPDTSLLPVINVVTAKGWGQDERPTTGDGMQVGVFASNLDHPRWLYVLPNGDVLVAETNAPPRPDDARGVRGFFFKYFQKKAGGAVASANRITLLRDQDGDGVAEIRTVFLAGLNSPFGMALIGATFYVANTDALVSFPYEEGQTSIHAPPRVVARLPGGALNHHWTKNIIASPGGAALYVAIGSNSNVAENGIEKEEGRANIWEVDLATGAHRVFAAGLRNPVGMALEPVTQVLWTVVNERDELGSDLVPDYLTSVRDGAFYGWPYSYFGQHVDPRVKPERPDLVAKAVSPDYALGPHTASLGLAFSANSSLPAPYASGAFIGQHGS